MNSRKAEQANARKCKAFEVGRKYQAFTDNGRIATAEYIGNATFNIRIKADIRNVTNPRQECALIDGFGSIFSVDSYIGEGR
jgi:hypothetical protein